MFKNAAEIKRAIKVALTKAQGDGKLAMDLTFTLSCKGGRPECEVGGFKGDIYNPGIITVGRGFVQYRMGIGARRGEKDYPYTDAWDDTLIAVRAVCDAATARL